MSSAGDESSVVTQSAGGRWGQGEVKSEEKGGGLSTWAPGQVIIGGGQVRQVSARTPAPAL